MVTCEIETYKSNAFIAITKSVREAVIRSNVQEGLVVVHTPHTTAGITITENADPDVVKDMLKALDAATPALPYAHAEGNSPSHFKSILTGTSLTIPISSGDLCLGIWQGIYFCEFDGPRRRKYHIQVIDQK